MTTENNFGTQPLDQLMTKWKLDNHDVVAASSEQLTHKMVAKGRSGRKLTINIKNKILAALRILRPEDKIKMTDVFNYPAK